MADTGTVRAAIGAMMIAWPEDLRTELTQKGLNQRVVAFPGPVLEPGIKTGRVSFPWETLRAWIEPALATGEVAFASPVQLTIPLQVVAPLFMALKRPALAQRKVQIPVNIPDLFAGKQTASETPAMPVAAPTEPVTAMPEAVRAPTAPPPEARTSVPAPAVPRPLLPKFATPPPGGVAPRTLTPAAAPASSAPASAPAAAAAVSTQELATLFGETGKLTWTPVELVQNACRLPGVAGTLIALADGLLVAGQMPDGVDGDAVAAFLPQIFARVAHYTHEIRLGEPSVVSFTVNRQVWQINKSGTVYFLTIGRVGENLPAAQIDAVAGQLDRQSKTN
jgi:predicted regulator of Ras-like GTPase activity (Roadblock/LC7/MglB family)